MDQLLQQIAEGNQNVEMALQALIKLQMEQGVSQEAAFKALITQAHEQNLEPLFKALIRLHQKQHDEILMSLNSIASINAKDMSPDILSKMIDLSNAIKSIQKSELNIKIEILPIEVDSIEVTEE